MILYEDHVNNTIEYKSEENSLGYDVTISFDDSKDPHEIDGINTTNKFSGRFSYLSERQVRIENLGSTYVGQPEWGKMFNEVILSESNEFTINHRQLRIYSEDKDKSVVLERQ